MTVIDLLAPSIPILKPNDSIYSALTMMSECHFDQLPLIHNGHCINIIDEQDLLDLEDDTLSLSAVNLPNKLAIVLDTVHPFEALNILVLQNLHILPVVSHETQYMGCITYGEFVQYFSKNSNVTAPIGIVILEIKPRDYTLSEIARIAESENLHIINVGVFYNNESDLLDVTIKVDRSDIQTFVAALVRYEYNVKQVFGQMPAYDDLGDRYKMLMNYLSI